MRDHPISVVIITKNEEATIAGCLESVRWADDVVVVDSGSDDRTVQIAGHFPCRVIQTQWRGFGPTKQFAAERASHDWILSLDADEVVTEGLARSIPSLLQAGPEAVAYRIRRRSYYLGRPIRFSGWQHDRPIRLFDRRHASFNDRIVHESVVVQGRISTITDAVLLHYPYPTISSHLAKIERYSTLGASQNFDLGRKSSIPKALLRGGAKFAKMFIIRGGVLDGKAGFVLAVNSSYGVFLKYLKLWELSRRGSST